MIFVFTGTLLLILYFFRISRYRKAFKRKPNYQPAFTHAGIALSVVIPYRNEAGNIPSLISSLKSQRLKGEYEVVLVNDHSSDESAELAKNLTCNDHRFIHVSLKEGCTGKKAALDKGISVAKNDHIVLTDADCVQESEWLQVFSEHFQQEGVLLISGPVKMNYNQDFFSKFQALEFLSLTGSGAASFIGGKPVMCSAANLGFRKSLYLEARNELHHDFPSGDDMFLMLFLNRHYPSRAVFMKSRNALVTTASLPDRSSFIKQRTRWSSKALLYRDMNLVFLALLVFLLNVNLLILLGLSFLNLQYFLTFIAITALKAELDHSFLKPVAKFARQEKILKIFLPSLIIYPFYIVFAAMSGFIAFMTSKR